jgi:UDP-N-acetylmuramoyl-L-alanyl-D-glutamate--2,6-diaminopimelate ligase
MTPPAIRLSALLRGAGVTPVSATEFDPLIRHVTLDSRTVGKNSLFCALKGLKSDGENYISEAAAQGAVAVMAATPRPERLDPLVTWLQVESPRMQVAPIARELHGRPDESVKLVGITGTNGKTTTTYMLDSIVRSAGFSSGRLGTVEYAWQDQTRPAPRTTPEGPELFALLAEMRDAGVQWVAMEVSSHALSLGRVRSASFDLAVLLNLRRDHLDFHENIDDYLNAKAILFEALSPDAIAVLNADDPSCSTLAARTCGSVLTFGRSATADVRIDSEVTTVSGSRCVLHTDWGQVEIKTSLAGPFNLENVAAAAACALAGGLSTSAVATGIEALTSVPGRMESVSTGLPFTVFVDYAHTDDALEALLEAARAINPNRILVVFGCGGNRDSGKRFDMGATAARLADLLFPTSDNPRDEDPAEILHQIQEGIASVPGAPTRTTVCTDREKAIQAALGTAVENDLVVIAGKGHETTQTVDGATRPFDDREVVRRLLAQIGKEENHADA